MNRKRVGSIVLLIILIGIAGVFYLIQRNADTKPDVVFEPPSPEVIRQIKAGIAARNAQHADRPPPSGETEESGYWHGDHWHKTGTAEQTNTPGANGLPPDFPIVTGKPKIPFWERLELDPPHGDMLYAWDGKGNYWKIYKGQIDLGEVKFRRGYAPTLEQYEKAKQLREDARLAFNAGNTAESERLMAEHDTLIEASQGDLPYFDGSTYLSKDGESPEEARENSRRQEEEAHRQLYREYGLEHLLD